MWQEPEGSKVVDLGECLAASDTTSNGINDGKNGGRICWAATGTFCGGKVQGTFAEKQLSCMNCEWFKTVKKEQKASRNFQMLRPGQTYKVHEH